MVNIIFFFFFWSENYFVRAKLYLRPETLEDKMKESSNAEVEVADWIYLTRSPVSTEHSKTNFLDALLTRNQRLQEHRRHSAVLNHCDNYWDEERAIRALPTNPRISKLNPEVRLILCMTTVGCKGLQHMPCVAGRAPVKNTTEVVRSDQVQLFLTRPPVCCGPFIHTLVFSTC